MTWHQLPPPPPTESERTRCPDCAGPIEPDGTHMSPFAACLYPEEPYEDVPEPDEMLDRHELPDLWDALPTALPHVELNPGGLRSMDCDLPGWNPWCDEDGRPLPVDP